MRAPTRSSVDSNTFRAQITTAMLYSTVRVCVCVHRNASNVLSLSVGEKLFDLFCTMFSSSRFFVRYMHAHNVHCNASMCFALSHRQWNSSSSASAVWPLYCTSKSSAVVTNRTTFSMNEISILPCTCARRARTMELKYADGTRF